MASTRILVVYHSSEGQTAKIAEAVAGTLRAAGHEVELSDVASAPLPEGFGGVVVGDPIHARQHSHDLTSYVRQHAAALNTSPSAFFQVSLTSANPDEEHTAAAQQVVNDFLQSTGFDPDVVGLFAGALVYTQYGWLKRRVMRTIAKREGGDTDMSHDYEYTDWKAVDRFATDFAALVQTGS